MFHLEHEISVRLKYYFLILHFTFKTSYFCDTLIRWPEWVHRYFFLCSFEFCLVSWVFDSFYHLWFACFIFEWLVCLTVI